MARFGCMLMVALSLILHGCASQSRTSDARLDYPVVPGVRTHDQIVVAGTFVQTGSRVVLWSDPLGFDAYKDARNFGVRFEKDPRLSRMSREDWTLAALRAYVDQIVLHYDAVGHSRGCFNILQARGLSAHFLIDTDGTIYQTMDVRERAWHATTSNDRGIGIEIANPGVGKGVRGVINGQRVEMPPFTAAQRQALASLCAALCRTLPRIAPDYPRDPQGRLILHTLDKARLASFHGVLGHYHIQTNKLDPGPAMDWDGLIEKIGTINTFRAPNP